MFSKAWRERSFFSSLSRPLSLSLILLLCVYVCVACGLGACASVVFVSVLPQYVMTAGLALHDLGSMSVHSHLFTIIISSDFNVSFPTFMRILVQSVCTLRAFLLKKSVLAHVLFSSH